LSLSKLIDRVCLGADGRRISLSDGERNQERLLALQPYSPLSKLTGVLASLLALW